MSDTEIIARRQAQIAELLIATADKIVTGEESAVLLSIENEITETFSNSLYRTYKPTGMHALILILKDGKATPADAAHAAALIGESRVFGKS